MSRRFEVILSGSLFVSTIFGTFPFKREPNFSYRYSLKLQLFSVALGFVACGEGVYWAIKNFKRMTVSVPFILDFAVVVVTFFTWSVVLVLPYFNRNEIPALISELSETNRNIRTSYSSQYFVSMTIMSFLNSLPKLFIVLKSAFDWTIPIKMILYFLYTNMPFVLSGQYSFLLGVLADQLSFLTRKLRPSATTMELQQLTQTHYFLCRLSEKINKVYNPYLTQAVILPSIVFTGKIYTVIVAILRPSDYNDHIRMAIGLGDFFSHTYAFVNIVARAMEVSYKAEEFNLQLLDIMLTNKSLSKNDALKTYLSMDNRVEQTAYGLFTFNYPLLISIMAVSTTYLILLVQFTLMKS